MIRNFVLLNFLLNQTLMVVFVTKIGAHGIAIAQEFIISMGKSYYDAYMEDLLFMANYETDRMFFYRNKENPDIFYLTEPPDCKVKYFY